MTLMASIPDGDAISAIILNINDDQWSEEIWLASINFPMLVLGSDNKGGAILQHTETEDLYYVQSLDLNYKNTEVIND